MLWESALRASETAGRSGSDPHDPLTSAGPAPHRVPWSIPAHFRPASGAPHACVSAVGTARPSRRTAVVLSCRPDAGVVGRPRARRTDSVVPGQAGHGV